MSQLTTAQQQACAAQVGTHLFGGIGATFGGALQATATVTWTDLQNAVAALDNALDTTINAAQTAGFGADTIVNGLAAQLQPPVSGLTNQQKYIILIYTLAKRASLI